ncbi:hypothetical protein [Nocardioides sp. B-3]|uniref:hypothetical protein n=1 Tax=Nocardioides sp. B-3 TaxID=2895565 RepID=UPI002153071A|nr:hypothetical protein [Nocardioides sp. B-3]UUZ59024.1 hypothetical protein LP418_24060 [Nocardioides sp. B-3]
MAVFVALTLGADGTVDAARISVAGADSTPVRADTAEALLVGKLPSDELFAAAADAVAAATNPPKDIHAPAEYRREMAAVLSRRALKNAAARANRGE